MKYLATTLFAALLLALVAVPANAQSYRGLCDSMTDVTIDQVNAIPQANINALNALGPGATPEQIRNQLTNQWDNNHPDATEFKCVRVEAVVISDPRYSGLASVNTTVGQPNRIHFFIRDVAAETEGPEGMTIMVVDDTETGFTMPRRPGHVIELEGFLSIFSGSGASPERAWQLVPLDSESIDWLGTVDPDLPWLQPVTVSTSDINMAVDEVGGETVVQANWSNWNSLNGQYVRVEGAVITNSAQADRPNWAFASVGSDVRVGNRDLSLRYRNDRENCPATQASNCYPNPPFFTRASDDPFLAPSISAVIDVQGFLNFGSFDAFLIGQPPRALFYMNPITDDDLVLTSSPPIIAVEPLTAVPTGPIEVFATVVSGSGDPLTEITLHYDFTNGPSGSVGMQPASGENRFSATIPVTASEDGLFVAYHVHAADSGGLDSNSPTRRTRVLLGGITQIEHIQRTWNDGVGPGPFTNISTTMNIEAVVMTDPSVPDIISVQDDPELNPWTGIFLMYNEGLATQLEKGDIIQISQATIRDGANAPAFGMTRLEVSIDHISVVGNQSPYPHITGLPTGLFAQDNAFAESYEGMAIRFDDVIITDPNPDDPQSFSEFAFSSDGTQANQLRARQQTFDASQHPDLEPGHLMFEGGEHVEFIQGILGFTHSNFKLLPQSPDDFGTITVDSESEGTAHAISLEGAYPNPVATQATIQYSLERSGHVRLEVFDVTGRRVAVLVDAEQTAGRQDVVLDASMLASGLYFVRLAADGEVRTTRVVITR